MASKFLYDHSTNIYGKLQEYLPESCSRPVPLALTATVGSLGIWLLWKTLRNRNQNLPPTPPGLPLLGNMMDLSMDIHKDLIRLQQKNNLPDVFMLKVGPRTKFIVLNSYDAIKDAFVTQGDLFASRPPFAVFDMMEVKAEIPMDFLEGFREKKAFIMSCMRNMGFGIRSEDTILEQVERLMNLIDKSSLETKPVQIQGIFSKTAANVIFKILFNKGYDFDDEELLERMKLIEIWYKTLMKVYTTTSMLPYWLGKLLYGKEAFKVAEDIRMFVRDEMRQHLQTIDYNEPRDFLDLYLTKKKGSVDDNLLANTVILFIPDAIQTVGCFVEWAFLYVVHHKTTMTRMQEEVDKATGGNRQVKWSDRPNLPYVEAVILEVVRLRSPATITGEHTSIRDANFRGYFIPKGMAAIANLYAALMDPEIFTNPQEFRPERWLTGEGKLDKTDTWIPFGVGHRMCVGDQITKIQVFLTVANLVQRYNMSFSEDEPPPSFEPMVGSTLKGPDPFKVLFDTRK